MNEIFTRWKNDKRYRTKINLLAYTLFVIIVSIYALSIDKNIPSSTNNSNLNNLYDNDNNNNNNNKVLENESNTINIPENYTYQINITIDNNNYLYYGEKTSEEEIITKENLNEITEYRYFNNEYYELIDNQYQKTNKEKVYDIVNYNYINLVNINKYLSKSEKKVNQYSVYLRDIILGNESDDYFIIIVNDNHLNIDYTPLIKEFNSDIRKYIVDIQIESKE